MKDQLGRELTYLRISVVDRCNLRCLYCMPADGAGFDAWEELLSYEEIVRACKIFTDLGIRKVRITGGEPLVRKGIAGLIARIRKIPGVNELALSTNGVFLREQGRALKEAGWIGSISVWTPFGGIAGSRVGAWRFSNLWLKRVLALVLWVAH